MFVVREGFSDPQHGELKKIFSLLREHESHQRHNIFNKRDSKTNCIIDITAWKHAHVLGTMCMSKGAKSLLGCISEYNDKLTKMTLRV